MKATTSKMAALAFVSLMLLMGLMQMGVATGGETRQPLILRVGAQDDIKTRNILASSDVWTQNALGPVFESVGQVDPATEEPMPYILKGIDADDSGTFDLDEYGVYKKEVGTNPRLVTAYYDLNGVYFHDGVQATMEDILFGYHFDALNPLAISLDVLKDKNNLPGSNYSNTHWLWVYPANGAWDPAIPVGQNASLRFALHFEQQADYARFIQYTLNGASVVPRHIWEGKGEYCLEAIDGVCKNWRKDIHDDFGKAYDSVKKNGVPSSSPDAFDFGKAQQWDPEDQYVVGTGPFRFVEWTKGVSVRLSKYENYYADALDKNGEKYMHQPYIDGITFLVYRTAQAAVFALQAGSIDIVSWSVPPEFVPDLRNNPDIGIQSTAEKGFFYLGYNMRKSPFGYPNNDPSSGDVGYWLRKAIAHVIDKKTIVTTLLQNFGVVADQPISPASVRWYNGSVEKYDYDLEAAKAILDNHYTIGGYALGYGSSGYRNLPNIGDNQIQILTPQADYDPIRAAAGTMIAESLKKVGINAESVPLAFGQIVERLDNRDMDVWILGWRIGSDPPDYFHAFFYSGNAPSGQNYPGFQNDTFDELITQARAELDEGKQAKLIKQCAGILADALPYDVLYFRQNIEAYRSDRFINWTVGRAGSIFGGSFWSLIGIHSPPKRNLRVSLSAPSAMVSEGTDNIKATVRDLDGNAIPDADVRFCVSAFGIPGNLTVGGVTGECVSGTSDINGAVIAIYQAPKVETKEGAIVQVSVSAEKEDMGYHQTSAFLSIFPKGEKFLSVRFEMETGDVVPVGQTIQISIDIRDQDLVEVSGATVNLTSVPEGLIIEPSNGTTIGGSIGPITVRAPSKIPSDTDSLKFSVVATADLTDHNQGIGSAEVVVFRLSSPSNQGGAMDIMLIGGVAGAVAVVAIVVVAWIATRSSWARRRKYRKK